MIKVDLSGRVAFVTGASSGFGQHFAQLLAAEGAHVVVAARRVDALATLVDKIHQAGGSALAVSLDVTDAASVKAAIAAAGAIDILVNNAGVTIAKPLLAMTEEDYDFVINTNQKGAFLVATEVARSMKARGAGGSIINIASILGLRQAGQVTAYAMSKAAIIQMTKQFALELARFNIRCNALAPGYFATELNSEFFDSEPGKALISRVPARRLGQLEDLDGPLLLLACDASRFMTGSVLVVDGGHLLLGL